MENSHLDELYKIVGYMYELKPKYRVRNETYYFRFAEVTGWYGNSYNKRLILLDFKTRKDESIFNSCIGSIAQEIMKAVEKDLKKKLKIFQVGSNHYDRVNIYVHLGHENPFKPKTKNYRAIKKITKGSYRK